uniref:AB hydrolase-1 domain-containing protein n=1 Tax=Oryza glumipatula TaxID=40148 RepID=A0A0D9Y8B1_9ORYZ
MMTSTVPATASRLILVHGMGHGGWCWYRVATMLRAAGHRVHAPDLAASGADARQLRDAPTFADYSRPLLDAVRALPGGGGERAVLVGHSLGGMSVALAAEELPEKVAAAVFVAAFMPDCASPRPSVIDEKLPWLDWMDSVRDEEHAPPSVRLGAELMRRKFYQLSPEEDFTLAQSLVRVGSSYVDDMRRRPPFSEARYGAARKVYVVCGQDQAIVEAYQRRMIADCPVEEVREIAGADHMAMFSAPAALAGHLADVANTYA